MAAAAKAPVFSAYDFENLALVLRKVDATEAVVRGTVETGDLILTIRFNDDECAHEVTKIELAR